MFLSSKFVCWSLLFPLVLHPRTYRRLLLCSLSLDFSPHVSLTSYSASSRLLPDSLVLGIRVLDEVVRAPQYHLLVYDTISQPNWEHSCSSHLLRSNDQQACWFGHRQKPSRVSSHRRSSGPSRLGEVCHTSDPLTVLHFVHSLWHALPVWTSYNLAASRIICVWFVCSNRLVLINARALGVAVVSSVMAALHGLL